MFDDIKINAGEFVVVCGHSGSGKTTFLKELLERCKNDGIKAGYVMQNFDAQIVTDNVWHELCFGLENLGTEPDVMHRRVAEVCSYFGIGDWLEKDTATLSGGQKQLLNLAGVMALTPELLLLDEPVSQLDPVAAGNFLNTVKKLNAELGITVVIAEHRLEELFECADRVLVFENVKVAFDFVPGKTPVKKDDLIVPFLPAAARIALNIEENVQAEELPLSVKDGRKWLSSRVRDCSGALRCSTVVEPVETAVEQWRRKPEPRKARPDALLKIKNLTFNYDKNSPEILSQLNLDIYGGEIFAVVGANGSGKSTLLKLIAGLKKPSGGKIKTDRNTKVFLLPQNVRNIFTHETVRGELESAGWDGKTELKVVNFGLDVHPYDVSGGEMQKLALEMILLQKPDIILLDEPTKGLDNGFKIEFSNILKNLAAEGLAVVIVCHDLEFCAYTADKVSIMFEGQLKGTGSPQEFFAGNNFYTTAVNRMCRGIVDGAVIEEDLL